MNRRDIKLLWEVATSGSVTRAAERLHVSQPAASAAIRQIEEQLGFALFTREKRRLELTPKGQALLPELSNALAALSSLDRLSDELRTDTAQRIGIACTASSTTVVPRALRFLREQLPKARIVVRTGLSLDIASMVAEQRVDFGIVVGDLVPQGCGVADIDSLGLYAIMRPDADLAAAERIALQAFADRPYITLDRKLHIGSLTARKFEEAGLTFNPSVEVMQFNAACAFAEDGYGVAILDALSVPLARKLGLVARPLDLSDQIQLRLLWPKTTALGKYADALRDALQAEVRAACATWDS
jgi:DNA-binding transcriptional LysR family regulator